MIKILLFFILTLFSSCLCSQAPNLGIPFIKNFPNKVYKAGTQNRAIQQHSKGYLFFANNNGLLQFDGSEWRCYPLKNQTIVRSLHIAETGEIYVGGQNEFGYFLPDELGHLTYHSLLDKFPEAHRNFTDVWRIIAVDNSLLFYASDKLFELKEENIHLIAEETITYLGQAANRGFVKFEGKGLLEYKNGEFVKLLGNELLLNELVTAVVSLDDQILVSTLKSGIFSIEEDQIKPWEIDAQQFLQENRIHSLTIVNQAEIAVGMAVGGVLILNKEGKIVYHFNRKNGLQNNSVLSVFEDQAANLWVGLENGIDYIQTNTPFSWIIPDRELEGAAYAAAVHNNQLYLGTSNGLFQKDWKSYYDPLKSNKFKLVDGTLGQVWGLSEVNQQLFLGHHEGAFEVTEQNLEQFSKGDGNWKFQALNQDTSYIIAGTYKGIDLFQKTADGLKFLKKFMELPESCRILEQDKAGNIWIAHPYRGIYKAIISPDLSTMTVRLYGKNDGLSSDNLNHVFKINEQIVFTGERGVYEYDAAADRFIPHQELNDLLGATTSVLRLFEDKEGNIWYVMPEETGIIKVVDEGLTKSFTKVVYPELSEQLVRGFELIYPYDEANVFIGIEKGFIHFNPQKRLRENAVIRPIISAVNLVSDGDSLLLGGQYKATENNEAMDFDATQNAFRFNFSALPYISSEEANFQCFLEGFDKNWSNWSTKREKVYTNLPPGDYTFIVKAKTASRKAGEESRFSFSINPPWYASKEAYFIYTLLFSSVFASLVVIPRRHYKEQTAELKSEQKRKDEEHQKVVEQAEKEMMQLKNANLQTEISFKNKELATTTMYLVQRNNLITKLQKQLDQIASKAKNASVKKEIRQVIRILDSEEQLDGDWEQFARHFDQVHIDFLHRLRQQYPNLTSTDEKLCAFLRMNLTSKEIAPLMHISVRGVEIGRYRLRKKLALESGVNLNAFMNKI